MKQKITIASTLKPVNDTRSYEKMAGTLSAANIGELHLIGFPCKQKSNDPSIIFHPFKKFNRLSIYRIFIPFTILVKYYFIKPQIIIISCHELIIPSSIYCMLTGTKLIYDIQENYFRNLIYQNNYPLLVRYTMAYYIRLKEKVFLFCFDKVILAEKSYLNELPFIGKKGIVIENKFLPINNMRHKSDGLLKLIISGTIAVPYGVIDGINLYYKIREIKQDTTLTIIGHCPDQRLMKHLISTYNTDPSIDLKLSSHPIDHSEIVSKIQESTIGLLLYQPNKSTANCIPTKLYEYMGYKLPILITKNKLWSALIEQYNAGVSLTKETHSSDLKYIIDIFQSTTFYNQNTENQISWKSEGDKLKTIIKSL